MEIRIGHSNRQEFILTEEEFAQHVLMSGRTGMGKSELLSLILVQMTMQGQGYCLCDTDSQTAQDTFARIQEFDIPQEFKDKAILLRPGIEKTFRFDPFTTELKDKEYRYWMHRQVKNIGRLIGRKQGVSDYKEQPRRERWMGAFLWMVGTNVDGKHLGIHRILDVLDVGTAAWDRIFNKLAPHLPQDVFNDLRLLRRMSPRDRHFYTESTANWFSQFLSDLVKDTFGGEAEPLDFGKLIQNGNMILADFGETPFFSKEQGEVFSAIVISSVMEACFFLKKQFYLAVEEADKVLGDDIGDWLARGRKRNCPLIICTQHVSQMTNRFSSIEDAILSQPGIHISFQHKGAKDLEQLALIHGTGELDFSLNWKPVDRPDGQDWIIVEDHSFVSSLSNTVGINNSTNSGQSFPRSQPKNITESSSLSQSNILSTSESESETTIFKSVHLPRFREEWYQSGLNTAVDVQFWMVKKILRTLGVAECLISTNTGTTQVRVHDISKPFAGMPKSLTYFINKAIHQMWTTHKFFFQPKEVKCLDNRKYKKPPETGSSSNT